MVAPANSTLAAIQNKVRRLTASADESSLTTATLNEYINDFYSQDFPYAIKIDQLRVVYEIYTAANVDRYPLDTNLYQGIRAPVYFEGIEGYFFKDRQQFFNMWPRWPTSFTPAVGDGTTQLFSFTIPGPFLDENVVISSVSIGGAPLRVADNGNGILQFQQIDSLGNITKVNIGTVNYVTGNMAFNFAIVGATPGDGEEIKVWVSQYAAARPYSLLFWNNEFTIRPVPDRTYKIEVEAYQTPTQFMTTSQNPVLNQWWKYIALGTARDILTDRQDMEGVENITGMLKEQEGLVLERQGVEEIGQRNTTLFSGAVQQAGWNQGMGWPY